MHKSFDISLIAICTIVIAAILGIQRADAQDVATISGRYVYYLGVDDDITLKDAKNKAIELAKVEALREKFGTFVGHDFINIGSNANDEFTEVYVSESTSSVKGLWLGDKKEPKVELLLNADGNLCIIAEVCGDAREIVRAHTELKWEVQKEENDKKVEAENFDSGSRFFINFKTPSDGYVAIYLITGDNETACLLPYRNNTAGYVKVKGGQSYNFFDKQIDNEASYYKLKTKQSAEPNQLVVLYSPNPINKCTETSKDPRCPNVLKSRDFAKWLLKAQRADNELVVEKRWINIIGTQQ